MTNHPSSEPHDFSDAVAEFVWAAAADDEDRVVAALNRIFEALNAPGVTVGEAFGTYASLAEGPAIFARCLPGPKIDFTGITFLNVTADGITDAPDHIPPPLRAAGRFLAAGLAGDHETRVAIFKTVCDAGPAAVGEFHHALIGMVRQCVHQIALTAYAASRDGQ